MTRIEVFGLRLPVVEPGSDLARLIVESAYGMGVGVFDGDVVVVTDKIVSKALGLLVDVGSVRPSGEALEIARKTGLDPRFVELVLRNCDEVLFAVPIRRIVGRGYVDLRSLAVNEEALSKLLEEFPVFLIVKREEMLWSDAGIDSSNLPPGKYAIPARDHDAVARALRDRIKELTGREVAVVICDTELFLGGSIDVARGSYGIDPVDRCFGCSDLYGRPKYGGVDIVAHEVCAAAALLFKQASEGIPAAIIRGLRYRKCECGFREALPKTNIKGVAREVIRETARVLGAKAIAKMLRILI